MLSMMIGEQTQNVDGIVKLKPAKEIASKRAGVEGIPSVLRRQYDVDTLPVRC